MAIIGRFAINITYNIGLQYAAELLPTVVRAQGVALIHIMGYVASILAPFVVYLVSCFWKGKLRKDFPLQRNRWRERLELLFQSFIDLAVLSGNLNRFEVLLKILN